MYRTSNLLLGLLKESHLSSITLSELLHSCFKFLYGSILSLKALLEVQDHCIGQDKASVTLVNTNTTHGTGFCTSANMYRIYLVAIIVERGS